MKIERALRPLLSRWKRSTRSLSLVPMSEMYEQSLPAPTKQNKAKQNQRRNKVSKERIHPWLRLRRMCTLRLTQQIISYTIPSREGNNLRVHDLSPGWRRMWNVTQSACGDEEIVILLLFFSGFLSKPNHNTYMIKNIIKKNTKITPKLSTTGGTSDARFIKKISPCLEFGLVGKTMHKVDEAVSLKDLSKLTKIYTDILENYFK